MLCFFIVFIALKSPQESVSLHFGHDINIMPLACLLELDHWGEPVDDLNTLAETWPYYRLVPMACNIQIIFYKHKKNNDVLVKFLLNESECKIPIATDLFPYYHWNDIEHYYRAKLNNYALILSGLDR